MSAKIVVPEMGESVSEAKIGRWLKKEGDHVRQGEAVVELETDKVDLEVGAEREGVLSSIERDEGEEVNIGDVLGIIEEGEAPSEEEKKREEKEPEARKGGKKQEERKTAEREKREVPEEQEEPLPEKADKVERAERMAERKGGEPVEEREPARRERPEEEREERGTEAALKATPTAERMAEEAGIDLSRIAGTGDRGRVTKDDVRTHLERRPRPKEVGPGITERPEERVPMSGRRRTIARRLVEAQRSAAMLTTFNEVDMSALMALRERCKDAFEEKHGVRLGIVSFFVKASIGALKAFPRLNAEVDGDDMVLKHYFDIGIAVGAEEGLVVPVLRDADRMSLAEMEKAIKDFGRRAREGRLTIEDLRGGTFTLSNGGVYGSLLSTPILNPPQVGILGLHRIEERAHVVDGEIRVRPMMYVALSYDHRIVDGLEAVQFLGRIKELIEAPDWLLLEG